MNTKTKGSFCELKVASRLLELGYSVSFPYGDNSAYDLIWDKEGVLYRIQCKSGIYKGGSIELRLQSTYYDKVSKKFTAKFFDKTRIDFLATYLERTGKVYLIPASELGKTAFCFRLLPPKRESSSTKWATTYEI